MNYTNSYNYKTENLKMNFTKLKIEEKILSRFRLWIIFICLLSAADAFAQQQNPVLRGVVTDASGAVVAGAALTLTNERTGAVRTAVSDQNGEYQFQQLPVGVYRLRAEKSGFRAFEQSNIELLIGRTLSLDVALTVGEVGETVTVDAGAATISSEDAAVGNSITEREVESLPAAGRNPISLFSLQPGIVFTGESDADRLLLGINNRQDDREGATFGVRGNQSAINIDGAEVGDTETQAAFGLLLPVTLDSIKEFRVTTNGANASEFNTGGPQVTIITNNGTNRFSGNARFHHRNDKFSANSFFNNAQGVERPNLDRNVFGGSFGGRIVRDRFFFFGDYEGRRERSEQLVKDQRVPSDTLRQGIISYTNAAGQIVQLTPEKLRQIDPAGLGFNPAMARIFDLYPRPNQPTPANLLSFDDPRNYGYFRFNSPIETNTNIYTARFDLNLTKDGRHTAYWRGTAADFDATLRPPVLPGLDPSRRLINRSKGFVVSYTAVENKNVINNFTWGVTFPRIDEKGAEGDGFAPTNLATPFGFDGFGGFGDLNRGVDRSATINDISDDVTLIRGNHTVQIGGLLRFSQNKRTSYQNAFGNFRALGTACRGAGGCDIPFNRLLTDPDVSLRPANNFTNRQRFRNAFFTLTAPLNALSTSFILNPRTGEYDFTEPRELNFIEDVYEAYVQDIWRVRQNLTVTAGLRYSFAEPIYEANGVQLRPLVDVREWFDGRARDMNAGVAADRTPFISFDRASKGNSWYEPDKNNFAPRLAVAWSPAFKSGLGKLLFGESKGVLRGGFGVYYERVGGALTYTTDRYGSPGLLQFGITPSGANAPFSLANAPRFSGTCTVGACANLPNPALYLTAPDRMTFPFTPQYGELEGNFIIDNRLQSPQTTHFNFSYQRELPGRITLDVGYVGTRGRKLLAKADVAQFYGDLRDPVSGQTLNEAYRLIADLIGPDPSRPRIDPNNLNAVRTIAAIPFFQNMMPNMPNAGFTPNPTLTPTQAFYVFATEFAPDWANALYLLDFDPYIFSSSVSPWNTRLDPERNGAVLFNPQFNNLPAWTNLGESDFHGLQLTVRKNFGRAAFAVNYTFSKSLDNTSSAENATENNGEFFYETGLIADAFNPKAQRARSDFDLRHNLNAHWLVDLPFGRGGWFGKNASGALDSLIGGWQIAGVLRWHSGFPLSPTNGGNQATNTFGTTFATVLGRLQSDITRRDPNGRPNLFRDPAAARALLAYTRPGEVGSRNAINGPGYFALDLGLHKNFRMPWSERHSLQLRATGFNILNTTNFSIRPPYSGNYTFDVAASASNFGALTKTTGFRGGGREFEFALRYSF
jgi:hypothetical protein